MSVLEHCFLVPMQFAGPGAKSICLLIANSKPTCVKVAEQWAKQLRGTWRWQLGRAAVERSFGTKSARQSHSSSRRQIPWPLLLLTNRLSSKRLKPATKKLNSLR